MLLLVAMCKPIAPDSCEIELRPAVGPAQRS